jgi:hypothetical protein
LQARQPRQSETPEMLTVLLVRFPGHSGC